MISFGIDIGGTFIKVLAINTKGEVLKSEKFKTPCQLSSHKFLQFLSETINNWKKELKTKQAVIGIGIAGDTDNKKGILRFATLSLFRGLRALFLLFSPQSYLRFRFCLYSSGCRFWRTDTAQTFHRLFHLLFRLLFRLLFLPLSQLPSLS